MSRLQARRTVRAADPRALREALGLPIEEPEATPPSFANLELPEVLEALVESLRRLDDRVSELAAGQAVLVGLMEQVAARAALPVSLAAGVAEAGPRVATVPKNPPVRARNRRLLDDNATASESSEPDLSARTG